MTGSNGIDVSNNNGRLDLTKGFSGLDFVIAKRSEGIGFMDDTFAYYQSEAAKTHALFGAYHFIHVEQQRALQEAHFFLSLFTPKSGMGVWIDYETYGESAAADVQGLHLFAMTIKAAYPKQRVGLYADRWGMDRVVPAGVGKAIDAYWLAEPGGIETPEGPMPKGSTWHIHQYEQLANVDRNYSRWTKAQMQSFFTW